jgi:PD-(D/E)XK endonuclease
METKAWTPRRQGNAGELSAIVWLMEVGAVVAKPFVEVSDYDLIADFLDGRPPLRVQVKTSTNWERGRFSVAVCTRGGNQSWNRIVKKMDASRCDYLFVHVGDGRRWFIPAAAIGGGVSIRVGGPKYADYEVEPGSPLQSRSGATE